MRNLLQLTILTLCSENCRGQGYDGASNMSGHVSGLAKRILDVSPDATFVHCRSHNLSLTILGKPLKGRVLQWYNFFSGWLPS